MDVEMIIGSIMVFAVFVAWIISRRLALTSDPIFMQWGPEIRQASRETGVPEKIIAAVIWQESRGNPDVAGGSGEVGLMQIKQIMIDDLRERGIITCQGPSWDPKRNIWQGAHALKFLKRLYGTWYDTLRAYNCCGSNTLRVNNNPGLSAGYAESVINKARDLGWMGKT